MDYWVGDNPLRFRFPRIYSLSDQNEGFINEMVILAMRFICFGSVLEA